jgi:hypothetical protein
MQDFATIRSISCDPWIFCFLLVPPIATKSEVIGTDLERVVLTLAFRMGEGLLRHD